MKKQLFKQLGHDNPETGKSKYKGQEAERMNEETKEPQKLKQGPHDWKLNSKA